MRTILATILIILLVVACGPSRRDIERTHIQQRIPINQVLDYRPVHTATKVMYLKYVNKDTITVTGRMFSRGDTVFIQSLKSFKRKQE
jgi:hypothetical protein